MSEPMKKYMKLFEDDNVSYTVTKKNGEIDKVIATLSASKSREFTMLAKKIKEANELAEKVKKLEEEIKGEAREAIAGLFDAEQEVYTRLVETASFSLQLSKKPEPTVTVKYASVLTELRDHLTPDLIKVLNGLEYKFRTVTQKQPALKYTSKKEVKEDISDNEFDKLKDYSDRYLDAINNFLINYDTKLEDLENEVNSL